MPRARKGAAHRRAKKRLFKRAEGFVGGRHRLYRPAKETVLRADRYATRDRQRRKRDFRSLWITRISAACRQEGLNYSRFIAGLKRAKVVLDRKMLAELAVSDPAAFKELAQIAKQPAA